MRELDVQPDVSITAEPELELAWRGREDYLLTYEAMRRYTRERRPESSDQIWLVEHPPVFTLGKAGDVRHLLRADTGVPLVKVDRGGQITYHGPGQVVAYLLVDLRRRNLSVLALVDMVEQAVIATLASFSIEAERKPGWPGIYIANTPGCEEHAGSKISALGLKVLRGCTYHGLSLNAKMDLRPYAAINACGDADLKSVDMATVGSEAQWYDVAQRLAAELILRLSGDSIRSWNDSRAAVAFKGKRSHE
ncbi:MULTISPECIES: lipoyl(octanoyl) transferase LipB [Paraburkholderia]|uniref:lipoyl(octanoyl) transferase LipB n=1 Tax=Paraburkholderia TaxID=1822464 RepID=UPI0032186E82